MRDHRTETERQWWIRANRLRHMPATPMSQEEMQAQCDFVSEAADFDPGEEGESEVLA